MRSSAVLTFLSQILWKIPPALFLVKKSEKSKFSSLKPQISASSSSLSNQQWHTDHMHPDAPPPPPPTSWLRHAGSDQPALTHSSRPHVRQPCCPPAATRQLLLNVEHGWNPAADPDLSWSRAWSRDPDESQEQQQQLHTESSVQSVT